MADEEEKPMIAMNQKVNYNTQLQMKKRKEEKIKLSARMETTPRQ